MESVAQDWFKELPKTVPANVDAMLAVAQKQRDIVESSKIITPVKRADGSIYDVISYATKRDNRQRRYRIEGHRLWLVVSQEKTVVTTTSNGKRNNFGRTFEVSPDGLEKAIANEIPASEEKDWFESMPKSVTPTVEAMQAIAKMQHQIIEDTKTEFVCDNGGTHTKYLVPPSDRRRWYKVEGLVSVWLSVTSTKASIVFKTRQKAGLPVTQESIDEAKQHSQQVIEERKNKPRKQHEGHPCKWCSQPTQRHCRICKDCTDSKVKRIWEAANSQCCLCGAYTNDIGKVSGKCGGCIKEEGRRIARDFQRKTQKARRADRSPKKVAADNARRMELRKHRIATDNEYAMQYRVQAGFRSLFSRMGTQKPKEFHGKWKKLIGCTTKELTEQFEEQFKEAPVHPVHGQMGWHNKQHWDIDHIFPSSRCCSFSLQQLMVVWNHKNLRPMWREDNGGKNNKLTPEGIDIVLELAKQQLSQALAS
jgi:hypothetical protein